MSQPLNTIREYSLQSSSQKYMYHIIVGQSGGSDLFVHGGQSNCSPLPDQDGTPNPDHTEAQSPSSPGLYALFYTYLFIY